MLVIGQNAVNLTNQKAPRNIKPEFIVKSNKMCVITAAAAKEMGLVPGDYVGVVEQGGVFYLHKGMKDDDTKIGGKLAGEAGKDLSFSGANIFATLKAGETNPEEVHTHFSIGTITPGDSTASTEAQLPNGETVPAYVITKTGTSAKASRNSSSSDNDDEEALVDVSNIDEAPTANSSKQVEDVDF